MYQHYKFSLEDSNYNDNIRTNPAHFNSMRAKPTYPQALIEVIPYDKNNYKKHNYYKFYFIYRIILVALNAFQIHGKEVKKNGNIFKMKRIAINVVYLILTKMKKYI